MDRRSALRFYQVRFDSHAPQARSKSNHLAVDFDSRVVPNPLPTISEHFSVE